MRYIKSFQIFESFTESVRESLLDKNLKEIRAEINLEELESYLIDFEQLGCLWDIQVSLGTKIKHPKDKLFLHSSELDQYSTGESVKSLNIELRPEGSILGKMKISLNDFSDACDLISNYLSSKFNLKLEYIYISNYGSYIYFPSVENVLKSDYAKIIANRITLSFK